MPKGQMVPNSRVYRGGGFVAQHVGVVTGKLGTAQKRECRQNVRKMSKNCPKNVKNCPEGLKTQYLDIFWTIFAYLVDALVW